MHTRATDGDLLPLLVRYYFDTGSFVLLFVNEILFGRRNGSINLREPAGQAFYVQSPGRILQRIQLYIEYIL